MEVRQLTAGTAATWLLATLTLPALVTMLPGAEGQTRVTCETNGSTDIQWTDLNVTLDSIKVTSLSADTTAKKVGKWFFVDKAAATSESDLLLEAKVKNIKTQASGPFSVSFTDNRPDGTSVVLGEVRMDSLSPNGEAVVRFKAENYNGTGEHKITVFADSKREVSEKCTPTLPPGAAPVVRETNNRGNQTVLFDAFADLRVTSLVAKNDTKAFNQATAASKVHFNVTVLNEGGHRAFNAAKGSDGIALVFDLEGDAKKCTEMKPAKFGDIAAAATVFAEAKCELAGLKKDFNVSVNVDSGKQVFELDENDNKRTTLFHLRVAELISNVTGVRGTGPDNAVPEAGDLSFTAVVRNAGDANASSDDDKKFQWFVYLDEKKDLSANMLANFSTKLAPGASTQASFKVSPVVRNLSPGAHKIFVVADSNRAGDTTKGVVIEGNETNNEFVLTFRVARFKENLTAETVAKTLSPGIEARYGFNLTNEGNANDTVAFTVSGAVLTTRFYDGNGTQLNSTVVGVAPNETKAFILGIQIPKTAAENSTLNVTLKAASTVPKANAVDTLTFSTTVGPDVVPPVIAKTKPTGNVVGIAGIVEFLITDNVAVTRVTMDTGSGPSNVTASAPDTYRFDPAALPQGSFQVIVTARDAKANEATANFTFTKDTVPPVIDTVTIASPSGATTLPGIDPGADVRVEAVIRDTLFGNATVRLGPVEAPMRRVAGDTFESVGLKAPSVPGSFKARVYAFDQGGNSAVKESGASVLVKGVDLTVQITDASPATPRQGQTVTFTAAVTNQGVLPASNIRVELLVDGALEDSESVNVPAGGTTDVELQWDAEPGPHTFTVRVDPANAVQETSETNNVHTQSSAALFPNARVFSEEALEERTVGDLLVDHVWVLILAVLAVGLGVVLFFLRPGVA